MRVLAINCGSSTVKFKLLDVAGQGEPAHAVAWGKVDRVGVGADGLFEGTLDGGETVAKPAIVHDHGDAARTILDWLAGSGLPSAGIDAGGFRVVHGGDRFSGPVIIDGAVLETLEAVAGLAPLHNTPALQAIAAVRSAVGPALPLVATFDTAFHRTLPEVAARYALPDDLVERHHIRRYGFHGLAHRWMVERYATLAGTPMEGTRLVTLQLGNGSSVTAVAGGRSVDTSMGFTPLEGLMMGTRSGDLDPALVGFLARREGVDASEVEAWLNNRSGLLGVSGRSSDMRDLLEAESGGDARAALAVEMYCYRARKYLGAYLAVLGGADAVVFGGGIGEHAPSVRARICDGMEWAGLALDEQANDRTVGSEGRISLDDAKTHAYVIPVDEELILAHDTLQCLQARP